MLKTDSGELQKNSKDKLEIMFFCPPKKCEDILISGLFGMYISMKTFCFTSYVLLVCCV